MTLLPVTRARMDDPEAAILEQRRALILPLAWKKIYQGVKSGRLTPLSVRCAQIALDHLDPVAKPSLSATIHGPVVLTWLSPSSSPTSPVPSSASSTTPGPDNGHAPPSSSAIDSLENL